jgi:hypothetical protein
MSAAQFNYETENLIADAGQVKAKANGTLEDLLGAGPSTIQ